MIIHSDLSSGLHVRGQSGRRSWPPARRTRDSGTCKVSRDLVLHEGGKERQSARRLSLSTGKLNLPAYLYDCSIIFIFISLFFCLSDSLSLSVSICLSLVASLSFSDYHFISLSLSFCCSFFSFSLSFCLSVSLSLCLSVSLSFCLSVSLSLNLF